jgi:hypothetical protein
LECRAQFIAIIKWNNGASDFLPLFMPFTKYQHVIAGAGEGYRMKYSGAATGNLRDSGELASTGRGHGSNSFHYRGSDERWVF